MWDFAAPQMEKSIENHTLGVAQVVPWGWPSWYIPQQPGHARALGIGLYIPMYITYVTVPGGTIAKGWWDVAISMILNR